MTVDELTLETPLADFVKALPARARTLEDWGLDYCCGGATPLEDACLDQGLDPEEVLRGLLATEAEDAPALADMAGMTPPQMCDHIEQVHHVWLKEELPRLDGLMTKVADAHGDNHPELHDIRRVFTSLHDELMEHMGKEEEVLFPMVRQGGGASGAPLLDGPIGVMEEEHDDAAAALESMRELSNGWTVPADGCASYTALMDGLRTLVADLHLHIHKENNILFPAISER